MSASPVSRVMKMGYEAFIARIDRPRAPSFHCDPSCWGWGCENCYGKALFAREGFTRLADPLRTLQGLVLLSINDMPAIRKICAGFTIQPVPVAAAMARRAMCISS